MTNAEARISKLEALSFIFAGVLFFASNLMTITLPKPPTAESEFFAWLSEHKFQIAMHDEILFFAAISLIPAAIVLYKLFKNQQTFGSALGLGLMVMAIPVLAVLDIVEGRLVYPVYDIPLSFDILKLVLSILHGGLHAVSLIFGASIIFISYAMRAVLFTKAYWYFGLITGVLQIIGSYPWLTGFAFNLIVLLSFSFWLVLSGIRIFSKAGETAQHQYNVQVQARDR